MPRTTRATRQQLGADGKQTSPLVALDDGPRRRRGAAQRGDTDAPVVVAQEGGHVVSAPKENERETTASTKSRTESLIPKKVRKDESKSIAAERQRGTTATASGKRPEKQESQTTGKSIKGRGGPTKGHGGVTSMESYDPHIMGTFTSSRPIYLPTTMETPSRVRYFVGARSQGEPSTLPNPTVGPLERPRIPLATEESTTSQIEESSSETTPQPRKGRLALARALGLFKSRPMQGAMLPTSSGSTQETRGEVAQLPERGLQPIREDEAYVTYLLDSAAPARQEEMALQGTYCISRQAFTKFLTSLDASEIRLMSTVAVNQSAPNPEKPTPAPTNVTASNGLLNRGSSSLIPKRKFEAPAYPALPAQAPKRRRGNEKPDVVSVQPLDPLTLQTPHDQPSVETKRYAATGGYDRNGNLVFPGQELLDSPPPTRSQPEDEQQAHAANEESGMHRKASDESEQQLLTELAQNGSQSENSPSTPTRPTNSAHTSQSVRVSRTGSAANVRTPLTQRRPRRGWGIASKVTSSLGKYVPFSIFARPTEETPTPDDDVDMTPAASEPEAHNDAEPSAPSLSLVPVHPASTESPAPQPAPVSDHEIRKLMLDVLCEKCPEIASYEVAANLQSTFAQREAKFRGESTLLDAQTDASTHKLLAGLKQRYPDLSGVEIYTKLQEVISQQQLLSKFQQARALRETSQPPQILIEGTQNDSLVKRKRRGSYEAIPNPKGASYGMDLDYFGDSSSDEENDNPEMLSASRAAHPRPSKRMRTYDADAMDISPSFSSSSLAGPTPYKGTLFDEPGETTRNVFGSSVPNSSTPSASHNVFGDPKTQSTSQQSSGKGYFVVPDDDDSDTSDDDEGFEDVAANTPSKTPKAPVNTHTRSEQQRPISPTKPKASMAPKSVHFGDSDSSASPANTRPNTQSGPPPAPTPSHAALPASGTGSSIDNNNNSGTSDSSGTAAMASNTSQTPLQSQHDPVALARAQANKYAPKTSSKLKSVSRLSNSPAAKNVDVQAGGDGTQVVTSKDGKFKLSLIDPLDGFDVDPNLVDRLHPGSRIVLQDPFESIMLDPVAGEYLNAMMNTRP